MPPPLTKLTKLAYVKANVVSLQGDGMTKQLRTDIAIDATPRRVWEVLTDFSAYPDWNPFIRRIAGPATEGSRLEVDLQPPGGRGITIRPTVKSAKPERELRWLGHLGVPGLFDGEHAFRLETLGDGRTRLVHEETFGGLLAPIVLNRIGEQTRQGFVAMNEALKSRAERG